jgi:SAM-dependent methyltransferase
VTEPGEPLQDALAAQLRAWEAKPLLRRLYRGWFRLLRERLADVPGISVELGSGSGRFRESVPTVVATDVEPTPWAQEVVDAEELPYEDGRVANLVLIDVFHHLARPSRFLDEARRVLAPGGRVLILDPYCSPVSTWVYRRFHHERTELDVPALADDEAVAAAPLASNQARATLAFFRDRAAFEERWPELAIVERRRFAILLYPLSGGFSRPQLVPDALVPLVAPLERLLAPAAAPLAAFRCLVVLERR